jgi:hypothetical protein
MLLEYPKDFPAYPISIIIQRLRGETVDNALAIRSAWIVCGYACSLVAPEDQPRIIGFEFGQPLSDGNLSELDLLNLLLTSKGEAVLSQGINWALIAKLATRLFMLFLLEKNPNA